MAITAREAPTITIGGDLTVRRLGFLPYSNSVHWRSEPERGPVFREAITLGELPDGYGVDDGTARGRGCCAAWR